MKKLIVFGIVALGFGLVGCSPEKKEEAPASTPVEQTVESTAPKVESEAPKVDNTQAVLELLQKGCSKIGTVHYDKSQKAYIITPTDPAFVQDLGYVLDSGDTQEWDTLVDTMAELSAKVSKTVGSGTSIAMANPANTSNVILIIADGVVVYDAVNEHLSNQ